MRRFWLALAPVLLLLVYVMPRASGYFMAPVQEVRAKSAPSVLATTTTAPTTAVPPTATVPTPEPSPTASATPIPSPTATPPPPSPTATPPPPPTATPPPPPPPTPEPRLARPAQLIIPAIKLNLFPIPVGLDARRSPIVPRHDVGWFTGSARPGEGSNVVFWGHVLRWRSQPKIPAPFARLHELQPGARVTVVTVDGRVRRYHVTRQVWVRPSQVQYILPTDSERITLVSCIGDKVIRNGELTKEFRLITIAEPAE